MIRHSPTLTIAPPREAAHHVLIRDAEDVGADSSVYEV